jgi:hypothetical protein
MTTKPTRQDGSDKSQWRNLAGYPWLPCPICNGVEGCSDTRAERARAYGHNIVAPTTQVKQ